MAHFEDLTQCSYFGKVAPEADLLAVGWLEPQHSQAEGEVPAAVFTRLIELLRNPWNLITYLCIHLCGICRQGDLSVDKDGDLEIKFTELDEFPEIAFSGRDNVFIPALAKLQNLRGSQHDCSLYQTSSILPAG